MAHYNDLKSYIQAKHGGYLNEMVTAFVNDNHDGRGFHSFGVLSICRQEVDNLSIKSVKCNDMPGPFVKVDVNLTADIVMLGLGSKKYEADRKTRWFTVHMPLDLRDGSVLDKEKTRVEEYAPGTFDKTTALDEFMVPYVYTVDLEDIADDFTLFYCQDAIYGGEHPYAFPYQHVLQAMEIGAYEADLPENNMGRMYFREDKASIYRRFIMPGGKPVESKYEDELIKPGTILLNKDHPFLNAPGNAILTIAHEIIHWYYHSKFFKIIALLDEDRSMMACDPEPHNYDESMSSLEKAIWFTEWQANAIGMRIAMPQELFVQAMHEAYSVAAQKPRTGSYKAEVLEDTISRVADMFNVSPFMAKQRAIQLGLDVAAGTHIHIDGHYHPPFYFQDGTLGPRQTFVINKEKLDSLCQRDSRLKALLDSGLFVYLGYLVCINDPQYIKPASDWNRRINDCDYELTEYAADHVDECCLIFDWESISGRSDEGGFYGQCYLSKDISAHNRVEHTYDPDFECNQDTVAMAKEIAKLKAAFAAEDKVMDELPRSFPGQLKFHMERKNITVEALGFQSKLSNTTIKKYRAGTSVPDIDNIMAIFIGLNLPEKYCDEMLRACGLSLTDVDTKQKVYRHLIREHSDGNLEQWNMFLAEFGLEPIPNRRNQKISA